MRQLQRKRDREIGRKERANERRKNRKSLTQFNFKWKHIKQIYCWRTTQIRGGVWCGGAQLGGALN